MKALAKVMMAAGLSLALLAQVALAYAQESPGTATVSDDGAASNKITVQMQGVALPPEGTGYTAVLSNADGSKTLTLGELTVSDDGTVNASFTTEENLVANYSRFQIFYGPPDIKLYEATIPSAGILHIRHLLIAGLASDDPQQQGYINGMISEAKTASTHAGLAAAAADSRDLDGLKLHAEHVLNIIDGTTEDYNGDGQGQNPGDGNGLLTYANAAVQHAQFTVDAASRYGPIAQNGPKVITAVNNAIAWADEAKTNVNLARSQTNASLAKLYMDKAKAALDNAVTGRDADRDGTIAAVSGEAGGNQAYMYAQMMATYEISAAKVGQLPSVGDPTVPLLPIAGLVAGVVLLLLGGGLLWRRRAEA